MSERRVATIAPMKRGLKVAPSVPDCIYHSSSNHCPDEKGTERIARITRARNVPFSSNHCPDEKGTERYEFKGFDRDITV